MKAYEMCRLKLEEQKVEQLERIADSLQHIEELASTGFVIWSGEAAWTVEPKRS